MYKHVRFESFPNRNLTKKRGRWKPGIENSIKNVRFESFPALGIGHVVVSIHFSIILRKRLKRLTIIFSIFNELLGNS